jgi:hypothetical protein
MALRRDTARNLRRALHLERAFVDAIGKEIATGRIKAKDGEKLILHWFQNRERVEFLIDYALRDAW